MHRVSGERWMTINPQDFSPKTKKPVNQVRNMEVVICLPVSVYDSSDESGSTLQYEAVMQRFESFCKQFCYNYIFQMEDSGIGLKDKPRNPHIQASIRLRNKKRPLELARLLFDQFADLIDDIWFKLERIDCRPTLRFNADELNFKYVTKEETRVCGPVTDHTIMTVLDFPSVDTFGPWQRMLHHYLLGPKDNREILNIYDPRGGCGKTTFQKWWYCTLADKHTTGLVDFSGSVGQVLASTVNAGPKEIYFINLPWKLNASTKQEKLDELGQAIESIKDGFLSTSYYGQGKTICFKNPHVVIFSNIDINDLNLFASDRVKTWQIPFFTSDEAAFKAIPIDTIEPNEPIEE